MRPATRISVWSNFFKALIAVVTGNLIYFFVLLPHLPPRAQHRVFGGWDLGLVIDFWLCLLIWGVVHLVTKSRLPK